MSNLFNLSAGKYNALMGLLDQAGLTRWEAEAILRQPALAGVMVTAVKRQIALDGILSRFWDYGVQWQRLVLLNRTYSLGFSEGILAEARKAAPANWPDVTQKGVGAVLVPYLATVQQTFQALWRMGRSGIGDAAAAEPCRLPDTHDLRLLEGIVHPGRCLRWELIDFDANGGLPPSEVRNPKSSPHAGVLAAAVIHGFGRIFSNDPDTAFCYLPGYQIREWDRQKTHDEQSWNLTPYIYSRPAAHGTPGFDLNVRGADSDSGGWTCPTLVSCGQRIR